MSTGAQPNVSLPRGAACVPCRQKKTKCDGKRPVCGQCVRARRSEQCEYRETRSPSNARALEQHIARLELRIRELSATEDTVRLQNPYSASSFPSEAAITPASQPQSIYGELSANAVQKFLQTFLPHAVKLGVFLDITRLTHSLTESGISGRTPIALLLKVVCLWGMHVSREAAYTLHEESLLTNILQCVQFALSAAHENQRTTVQVLQAEILLANYLFDKNRLLGGRLHAQAAMSLALICGLHKLGLGATFSSSPSTPLAAHVWLPFPADRVEYQERIKAWWQVFIMDKAWAVALASPSVIENKEGIDATIDTPWPLGDENDDLGLESSQGRTVQRFHKDVLLDTNTSSLALLAKATALYEKAYQTELYRDRNVPHYTAAVTTLDTSIESFKQILPAFDSVGSSSPGNSDLHSLLLASALCHCATIHLHRGHLGQSVASMTKCTAAANAVARHSQHFDVANIKCVNPIIAVLWTTASDALVNVLRILRPFDNSGCGGQPVSMSDKEETLVTSLNTLTNALRAFGQISPLFDDQLTKFRPALDST